MPRKKALPAPAKKKRTVAKMTTSGRPLTEIQRESILQVYALTGNKSETARQLGVSESTVYNVLRAAQSAPAELRQARADVVTELAGRVHATANRVLDSISDADLESGRIEDYDDAGKLTRVQLWGPSLLQKVTSVAILADKTRVLNDMREGLLAATDASPLAMPLPQDVDAALRSIAQKVRRLRIMDVQFDQTPVAQELSQKIQDALCTEEIVDAEYAVIDEFDN